MARTEIAVTSVNLAAAASPDLEAAYVAADQANGMLFANARGEKTVLVVKNGDVAGKTVTIASPRTVDGQAVADPAIAVAAGEVRMIGPFSQSTYNQGGSDVGKVYVDFDADTSVEVAAVKLG